MGVSIDADIVGSGGAWTPPLVGDRYATISACGRSFGRGIFRFHDSVSGPVATRFVAAGFPHLAGVADVVAFDWRARQFAVVAASATPSGTAEMVLLDPYDMSLTPLVDADAFLSFFTTPDALALLDPDRFAAYLSRTGTGHVPFDRCAAPRVPAFLGGSLDDLEDSDPDVHWTITTQLHRQTAHLPAGTTIDGVRITG